MSHSMVIHIGMPKTGSTALQQFLETCREELCAGFGVCYPSAALRAGGHHDLAFLLGGGYPEWATPGTRPLDELLDALRTTWHGHHGSLVVSSENFALLTPPAALAEALGRIGVSPDKVRIVIYLRRQDLAHESWYNQTVKAQGYAWDFDEYFADQRGLFDYDRILEAWAGVFGWDRLVPRRYAPDGGIPFDVVADFLGLLSIPADRFPRAAVPVNTGLNRDLLEYQRQINRLPLTPQEKRRHHRELMALSRATAGSGLFDESPLLTYPQRKELLNEYREGNRRVADRWFGGGDLFGGPQEPQEQVGHSVPGGLSAVKLALIREWIDRRAGGLPSPEER